MMQKYDIESLEKKFKEHAEEYIKTEKKRCEDQQCVYIENFNLCEALQVICHELKEVKIENQILKKEIAYGKIHQRFSAGNFK